MKFEEFTTKGIRVNELDIQNAAQVIGCLPEVIKTVIAVEAGGNGFNDDGTPKILFEAHHFSRLTKGKYDASHPTISSPKWNKKLYKGGKGEYTRLMIAISLDEEAALKSCSWGLFQILGSNFKACGFNSAVEFVKAQLISEGSQLISFIKFIKANSLDDELRDHKWVDFARQYNGPSYKANQYDVKLLSTFNKLKDKDDPVDVKYDVEIAVQRALNVYGYKLVVDGNFGKLSKAALCSFKYKHGLAVNSVIDDATLKLLGINQG